MRKKKRVRKTERLPDQGHECAPPFEEPATPYHQMAGIIDATLLLAAEARRLPVCDGYAPPTMDRLLGGPNCITNGWDNAVQLARNNSLSRGIPFAAFDPVLTEARFIPFVPAGANRRNHSSA
jgi:hypothetical protein